MSVVFCCIKNCFNGIGFTPNHIPRQEISPIILDTNHMGHEVVVVKNGLRICGSGGALGSAPLVQSKSYFEVKIQQSGIWGVGLATRNTDLDHAPGGNDSESWTLGWDGVIRHNNSEVHKLQETPQEGDIIGITYDHIEMKLYLNGKGLETNVSGVRGQVYPVLFVDDGAILDIILDGFNYQPPNGFDKIMLEQSLL